MRGRSVFFTWMLAISLAWTAAAVGCREKAPEPFLDISGTLEAREVKLASKIAGRVATLPREGESVHKNAVVVTLVVKEADDQLKSAESAVRAGQDRVRQAHVALKFQAAVDQSEEQGAAAGVQTARAREAEAESAYRYQVETRQVQESQAEAAVRTAESNLKPIELQRDHDRRELKRVQQLYDSGFVAASKVDEARTAYNVAQSQYQVAATQVEQARANLAQARAQAGLDLVRQADRRVASAGVSSAQSQVLTARAQRVQEEVRQQDIQVAQSQLDQARAALDLARTTRANATILCPLDGTVLRRTVEEGELVAEGETLATVADLSDIWVTVYVPEQYLRFVRLGGQVPVAVDSFKEKLPGTVSFVSTSAEFTPKNIQTKEERITQTYKVKIRLPNEQRKLYPGMAADVSIKVTEN